MEYCQLILLDTWHKLTCTWPEDYASDLFQRKVPYFNSYLSHFMLWPLFMCPLFTNTMNIETWFVMIMHISGIKFRVPTKQLKWLIWHIGLSFSSQFLHICIQWSNKDGNFPIPANSSYRHRLVKWELLMKNFLLWISVCNQPPPETSFSRRTYDFIFGPANPAPKKCKVSNGELCDTDSGFWACQILPPPLENEWCYCPYQHETSGGIFGVEKHPFSSGSSSVCITDRFHAQTTQKTKLYETTFCHLFWCFLSLFLVLENSFIRSRSSTEYGFFLIGYLKVLLKIPRRVKLHIADSLGLTEPLSKANIWQERNRSHFYEFL